LSFINYHFCHYCQEVGYFWVKSPMVYLANLGGFPDAVKFSNC
jgi:hypothetical protein